jgi:hypothetical protein
MNEHNRELARSRKRLKQQHFFDEDWSDFARGQVRTDLGKAMRQHTLEGCRKCQQLNELWHGVAVTAAREGTYVLPDHAIRAVKGQFGLNRALPWKTGVLRTARMVFDSFKSPMPSGVRSSAVKARQLVYQVGEYFLDVRMEPEPGSKKLNLIGQIRDSLDPVKKMGESPVILLRGQDRLVQTTTNVFGEFRLEFDRKDNLWLAIGIQGEAGIVVPLERVVGTGAAESGR